MEIERLLPRPTSFTMESDFGAFYRSQCRSAGCHRNWKQPIGRTDRSDSETFSNTSNWSLGAISINPTTADIGVTTSVSAVAFGQNSTYNITVTNSGPSAANSVVLTDTLLPASRWFRHTERGNNVQEPVPSVVRCQLRWPVGRAPQWRWFQSHDRGSIQIPLR